MTSLRGPLLRRLLGLASPFAAVGIALCSDSATGPDGLRPGTFRLSVTGEAVADGQLYGTSRDAATRVDTTEEGRPIVRHELVLEDRDADVRLEVTFFALAAATGERDVVAATDSLPPGGGDPPAAVSLEPGTVAPAGTGVRGGRLTITVNSTGELAGRLRVRAVPPADTATGRSMYLDGEFRATR